MTGEIRVGSRYQADGIASTVLSPAERETDSRRSQDLETLVWTPRHSLTDRQIDQFLVVSRSVGTFARALDCSSSVKQPSLHMSAAAASRDITLVSIVPYVAIYCIIVFGSYLRRYVTSDLKKSERTLRFA